MVPYLGDFKEDDTVLIVFNTFTSNDPSASCTITNFINTDVHIHKEDDLAQRNNAAGITVSVDFDGITGSHMIKIDTSDNTVAGFYVVAKDYFVRIEGTTIDGATINVFVGHFSIENRFQEVDVVKWLGQACHAVSENGVPKVDLDQIAGVVQSLTDFKDFVDAGYDPVNHEIVGINDGVLVAAKFGADCITNAKIADDAIAVENIKGGAITAAKIASDAITAAKVAADVHSECATAVAGKEYDNDGTAISLQGAIKLLLAVLTGKSSGGGTATLVFRDVNDAKNRISATVDADGNRTAVGTRDAA